MTYILPPILLSQLHTEFCMLTIIYSSKDFFVTANKKRQDYLKNKLVLDLIKNTQKTSIIYINHIK